MSFKKALDLTLELEGKTFTNHPLDLGGPTFWGLTQSTYSDYCDRNGLPDRLVQTLAPEEIAAVYKAVFWNLPQDSEGTPIATLLGEPADAVFFQLAVNLGGDRATKMLQAAIMTEPDGSFGPKSRAALKAQGPKSLCDALLVAQLAHYATVQAAWDAVGLFNRVVRVSKWINSSMGSQWQSLSSSSPPSPSGSPLAPRA